MTKAILIILTLAGFASGAELEIPDRLSVDGASVFRSSVAVVNASTQTPYSLAVGTSTNYSLTVSTGGRLQANEIYRGTYTVLDSSMLDANGLMKVTGIQNTGETAGISVEAAMADKGLDYMEYASEPLAQAAYVSNAAGVALIQSNTNITDVNGLGNYAGNEYGMGQAFTISAPSTIDKIVIYFSTTQGSPTGQATCRIETDSGGFPSGSLVHANATVAIVPTQNANNTFDWADFSLAPGTYWIVLKCDAQVTNTRWWLARGDPPSPDTLGGNAIYTNGVWSNYDGTYWTCTLYYYTQNTLQSYSDAAIKTQGLYSLKGVAAITTSLNKTLTRTISPPLDLSGRTQINFDIRSSTTGSNIKIGLHDSGGTTEITPAVISSDAWQTVNWNIAAVPDNLKDAIDSIVITITSAPATNTFYIDNMFAPGGGTTKDITFTTAVSERMRIDSTGNVGIGTTNPAGLLQVGTSLIVTTGGNVGIGTTASLAPLHVASQPLSATGGTITYSGEYTIHTFTSNGTFTITAGSRNVEVLVVGGGGGGGGGYYGAGGGGGGLVYHSAKAVTTGNYTVTVGGRGIAGVGEGVRGGNGGNSVFGDITANGGGGGGCYGNYKGLNGGSGGGGGGQGAVGLNSTGGSATQGNSDGGAGYAGGNVWGQIQAGAGGGGAGAVGGDVISLLTGGAGGNGGSYSISGTAAYYAGGGGGGVKTGTAWGVGGNGGGGRGGGGSTGAVSGTANTGGGGGGSPDLTNDSAGAGGSGIVIVRYLTSDSGTAAIFQGNVGIGTAGPGTKLHIEGGTIRITGSGSPATGGALCLNGFGNISKCTSTIGSDGNCTCP